MRRKDVFIFSIYLLGALLLSATETTTGVLGGDELKRAVPSSYFFRGQSASVQLRNSAGFRVADGKLVLAGLVDTSGYAADVAQKYQGFLITEVKLKVEGTELPPGQYGFGFRKDDKFTVMDVGENDLLNVTAHLDDALHRPVPLKIVADQSPYRLYSGKKWVGLKTQ